MRSAMGETSALPINTGRAARLERTARDIFWAKPHWRIRIDENIFSAGALCIAGALRIATTVVQSTFFATQEFTSLDTANDWIDRRRVCAGIFQFYIIQLDGADRWRDACGVIIIFAPVRSDRCASDWHHSYSSPRPSTRLRQERFGLT